ncbi:MAG: RidA family protein [Deltaproteobacteria bacterium]|nr:RidA family protein [Deltaproteobacteria bacterium]
MKAVYTELAPKPIGAYSQAISAKGNTVFFAGQIGLEPQSGLLVEGFTKQAEQVFANIDAVAQAAGGSLKNIVKVTIFLLDMNHFAQVNSLMERFFDEPYPARSTVQVSALPKGALIEIEAVMIITS